MKSLPFTNCHPDSAGQPALRERRYSYAAHCVEGGIYMAALAFVSAELVLPNMARQLGGGSLMISFAPILMMVGFMLPPLFVAHWVERLERVKPFIVVVGFFQRLPFLAIALFLYFRGDEQPLVALVVAFAGLVLSGAFGGISMTAWMEFVDRTITTRRISSCMAIRNTVGALLGIGAGYVIERTLSGKDGASAYATLFAITFGLSLVSYFVFMTIKEPVVPVRSRPPAPSFWENLRSLPALFRSNPGARRLLWVNVAFSGLFVIAPFMGIHAVDTTGRGEGFIGELVAWQMGGSIAGNFLAGYLGDRIGPKLPMCLGRILLAVFCICMAINTSPLGFQLLFFLFGVGFFLNMSSRMTLVMEVCASDRRPTFVAATTAFTLVSLLAAAGLSAAIREFVGTIHLAALVATVGMLVSLYLLLRLPDTRGRSTSRAA